MGRSGRHRTGIPIGVPEANSALVARLREQLGDEVDGLENALATEPVVSIRVNPNKWSGPQNTEPVPWCGTGHYLAERPAFTFDPLLHAGAYYVQEASSMLLEQAVLASGLANERIAALDLCAAPGGKSTHLRSLLHADTLLVSNEIDPKRATVLQENLWKWGAANSMVTCAAPQRYAHLQEVFDLVVVDAPCSGEGMFRKDAFAREQWKPALVKQCSAMQHDALEHAWNCLRPGGMLIYSTCTWEIEENEAQVAALMARGGHTIAIPTLPEWGMQRTSRHGIDAVRCYPHRVRGEGSFIALLRKAGERTGHAVPRNTQEVTGTAPWLLPSRAWNLIEMNAQQFAIDATWSAMVERIRSAVPTWSSGVPYAERKGITWRPHPGLAFAQDLDRSRFHSIPLDHTQAITMLRGNALSTSDARGAGLATYQDVPLGWLQGAGDRWNNRWPAAWRIRSARPSAPLVSWSA